MVEMLYLAGLPCYFDTNFCEDGLFPKAENKSLASEKKRKVP